MVLKLYLNFSYAQGGFENDVKMYGTQTDKLANLCKIQFENDVKMYGTQTFNSHISIFRPV